MNRWLKSLVIALVLSGGVVHAAVPASSSDRARQVISFDPGWRFFKGDAAGAEKADFKDAEWATVDVPHDWSIEGPYDENAPAKRGGGYLPSGISWYRKTFTLPSGVTPAQKVFIHFDGIMANAEVWINGHSLGKRPYGYVPQHYELSGHLVPGNNVISVKTDTTIQPASRWYTGQGIYRHVNLMAMDPVHIEQFGTYITTADNNTVKVKNTVVNQSDAAKDVTIQTVLIGPDGKQVQAASTPAQSVPAGKSVTFEQEIKVADAKLWNLDQPNLYSAVSKVQAGNMTLDEEVTSFGIRTSEYKPESGFWLNGKNIKILGACLHHDGGSVGAAVPLRVYERRLEILRSIGVNAIRTAHNPPSTAFMELCDRMGFLVMEETFDTWTARKPNAEQGYQNYFNDWWEKDTTDAVLRDRNHPSLVIWSIGNEIRDNLTSPEGRKRMQDQLDVVHKLDPSRPVTMGLFRPTANAPYLDLLDVIGANYNTGFLLQIRRDNPNRRVTVSEDSHGAASWLQVRDNAAIAGTFIWSGFDYLGETAEAGSWPYVISSSASEGFGLVEHTGYMRPRAYQRQSWWSPTPVVHVSRHLGHAGEGPLVNDWSPADQGTFDKARVQIFTNCDEAELFLNDKSIGSKPKTANAAPIIFDLDFEPGTLKVVGKNAGKIVATHEMKTAGDPVKLAMSADRMKVANTFDDLSHITASIVDKDGVTNPNLLETITFKVTGPGKLVAVGTGQRDSHEVFTGGKRKAYHGEVMALVRATGDSGKITVTATAEGLEPATITIDAAPAAK